MDALEFFRAMFPNLGPRETINVRAFHARSGVKGYHEFCGTPEAAAAFVATIPSDLEIYCGVNPRNGRDGTKAGVAWVQVYHADVDWKWYGGDRDSALDAVIGWELQPSLVVESGHGFHCYWFLANPLPPSQFPLAEDQMRRLYFALGGLDNVQDVSRILRVPGTYNNKDPRNRKLVKVVHDNRTGLYTPEQFEQFLPQLPRPLAFTEQAEIAQDGERPSIEALRELLSFIDPCVPYSEYYSIWAAVAYYYPDEEGLALVDEWSSERREAAGQYSSPRTQPEKHQGFRRQTGRVTTLGTLVHLAKQGGFAFPERPRPLVVKTKGGSVTTAMKKRREEVWRKKLDDLPNPTYDDLPEYLSRWYDHLGILAEPFPRDYTSMMGLTFASLWFPQVRFENLGLNLWINASVEQGSGKNAVTDAMFKVIEKMTATAPFLYTSGTAEGMFRKLKGENKQMICYLREFGDYLSSMSREHMKGARGVLCNLYDGSDIAHHLSKEEVIIKDPYCVIIGTTTPNVLVETMTKQDLEGGFASRFWYLAPDYENVGRNNDPTPEAAVALAAYFDQHVLDLGNVRYARFDCPRGEVPSAYQDYMILCGVGTGEKRSFIDALENPRSPKGRFLARVKKVATLLELLDAVPQIEDGVVVVRNKYLELAITFVRRSEVYQEIILNTIGDTAEEKSLNIIMRVLNRAGTTGLTRSQIMQQSHVKSQDMKAILPLLSEEGLIEEHIVDQKPYWRSTDPNPEPPPVGLTKVRKSAAA